MGAIRNLCPDVSGLDLRVLFYDDAGNIFRPSTGALVAESSLTDAQLTTALYALTEAVSSQATKTGRYPLNYAAVTGTLVANKSYLVRYVLGAAVPPMPTFALDAVYWDGTNVTALTTLDLTQAVPTSNTAQTLGDALNAARAQGFGKWTIVGTTLTLYANDGITAVRAFTLAPNANNPSSRTPV